MEVPSPPEPPQLHDDWIMEQDLLRRRVIVVDDPSWAGGEEEGAPLRYVGGVDVGFLKDDPSIACGALTVVDLQQRGGIEGALPVVHEVHQIVRLRVPYVPGFLAFREAPVLLRLLEKIRNEAPSLYPQVLMVDGNGILHPRGSAFRRIHDSFLLGKKCCGLACHLGVLANLPTIGIGKNLHHVDGLTLSMVRKLLQDPENSSKDVVELVGDSGRIWGAAMRSTPDSSKPIFVSIGHRLSLDSCIRIVKMCSKYRVPEPIRQADIRSRRQLQSWRETTAESLDDEQLEIISPRSMSLDF